VSRSDADEVANTDGRPVGLLIVTRRGAVKPDASATDLGREIAPPRSVINENENPCGGGVFGAGQAARS
jgi:hypothetical protein